MGIFRFQEEIHLYTCMVEIAWLSSLFGPLNKGANFWHTQVAKPDQRGTIKNETPGYGWRTQMFPQPMVFPLRRLLVY